MAKYRSVQMSFWTDSKVIDEFSPAEKLVYLHLMTNPHTSLCGCYEISKMQIAMETGFSISDIEETLNRLENIHGVIRYSCETKEVLIINWHKYNWTPSDKVASGVMKGINEVKNKQFLDFLNEVYDIVYPSH